MVIALWIVVPILTYLFVAGMLRKPLAMVSAKNCKACIDGNHEWVDKDSYSRRTLSKPSHIYHGEDGSIRAAFWPFTLPWTAGTILTGSDRATSKKAKAEARRAEELVEAEHQVELARLRKKENEFLDQHLKLAEIERRVQDK
jgi:hypothetical protein